MIDRKGIGHFFLLIQHLGFQFTVRTVHVDEQMLPLEGEGPSGLCLFRVTIIIRRPLIRQFDAVIKDLFRNGRFSRF